MENTTETIEEIIDNLLTMLSKENEQILPKNLSLDDKRFFIDIFILLHSQGNIDAELLILQDRLLSIELEERKVDLSKLDFRKKIATLNGSITDVETDIAIVFSNNLFTNNNHLDNNIDNLIIKRGGMQIQEEFAEIFSQNYQILSYQTPYIVNGHNLACKKLAKILLNAHQTDINNEIKNCVSNNLAQVFKYAKENNFKTISINLNFPTCYNVDVMKHIVIEECKKLNKKLKAKLIFVNKI